MTYDESVFPFYDDIAYVTKICETVLELILINIDGQSADVDLAVFACGLRHFICEQYDKIKLDKIN